MLFSSIVRATTVATPVIVPTSGTSYTQFRVTVTDATSGSSIYYTLDGTTPTTSSSPITTGSTVLITKSEILNAFAVKSGLTNSAVNSGTYTVTGQIAAGQYHTVTLKSNGTVWSWGYNLYGEVGDGTMVQRNSAVQVTSLTGISEIAAGIYHTLALTTDGYVWAWGLNSSGQLGDGTTTQRSSPVLVKKSNGSGGTTNLTNIVAICAGAYHNLALDSSGHVWAWGLNTNGQLGDGTTTQQNLAEQITALSGVSIQQLAAGGYHSLVLTSSGTVQAWGLNSNGQLGDGTTAQRTSPVAVSGLSGVSITALSGGAEHTLALQSDGSVWAWGLNANGEVGDGTTTQRNSPVHLSGLSNVAEIEAGYSHSLVIKTDNTVWGWGTNTAGELGDGTSIQRNSAVQATGVSGAIQVGAGNETSLVLNSNGTISVFGANNCGQLGDGVSVLNSNALPILGMTSTITKIANGSASDHDLAIDTYGQVWSWGNNVGGQLGDGTNYQRITPAQITFSGIGTGSITAVAANGGRSMALDSAKTVWSWGLNSIGNGTTTGTSVPVHLSGLSNITAITEGSGFGAALDSNNNVWAWGDNTYGQVGDGTTTTPRNSPLEVKNYSSGTGTYLSGVTAISAGDYHMLALAGGAVYAWGYNSNGQLGDNTTTNRSLPVLVTGLSGVTITAISAGNLFSSAVDSGGHVWMWGNNAYNQMGNGNTTGQKVPVEVTNTDGSYLSGVVTTSCGNNCCLALKSDGTVCGWGINNDGQLADGTLVQRAHPVQAINVSAIKSIGTGRGFEVALKEDGTLLTWGMDGTGGVGVQANYGIPFVIPGFNALATVPTPTVSITAPANNTAVALNNSQTFTVSAAETGGTIANVNYYINSTLIATSTTGSAYSFVWAPSTWGNFTFVAIATDTNGNTSYRSSQITAQVPYDSDGNGLPDWWEIANFGHLGNYSSDDPDNDGLTNLQEYQQKSDPNNYYSQGAATIVPTITVVSGNNQDIPPNLSSPLALVVQVTNSSGGAVLASAPVTFSVTAGGGQIAAYSGGPLNTSIQLTTDASGQAEVYFKPPSGPSVGTITATTAGHSVAFTESQTIDTNGIAYAWELLNYNQLGIDPYYDPTGSGYPAIYRYTHQVGISTTPTPDFVVDAAGSTAYSTIQSAINATTSDYQIISIMPGTYTENPSILQNHKVLIRSTNGAASTIINAQNGTGIYVNNDCVIDGLTFTKVGLVGIYADGVPARVMNCVFFGNSPNLSLFFAVGTTLSATNCTTCGNTLGNGNFAVETLNGAAVIKNCILWDGGNEIGTDLSSGAVSVTATYCDIQGSTVFNGAGNINSNPLLGSNYHLTVGSPCIDNGTAAGAPIRDMDNEARPSGSGYDIGADEYVDTNGAGLPDWWQKMYFSQLGVSSSALSPNGDQKSNLVNYQLQIDPINPIDTNGFTYVWELQNYNQIQIDPYFDPNGSGYPAIYRYVRNLSSSATVTPDFVVDAAGSTSYHTISSAIAATTHDYQIISVLPGTYVDRPAIYYHKVLVRSTGGATATVIDIQHTDGFSIYQDTVLDGFTIINANGHAVGVEGTSLTTPTARIIDCVFAHNQNTLGILYALSGGLVVTNCTLLDNPATVNGVIQTISGTANLTNCILWDGCLEIGADWYTGFSAVTVQNCDIFGGFPGNGNTDADPVLWADGHLNNNSPAIGAGTSIGAPNRDMDNEARPTGSRYDIGADQYVDSTGAGLPDWFTAHGISSWWKTLYFGGTVSPGQVTANGATVLEDFQFNIDPTSTATIDRNNMTFAWENQYFGTIRISPSADPNGDGISNYASFVLGYNPVATPSSSVDTDGDGIPDYLDAYPNDPTRWLSLPNDPNDHTAPVIELDVPTFATPVN